MSLLRHSLSQSCIVIALWLVTASASASLVVLDDQELEKHSGSGIALALDSFDVLFKPTSYFEQVGSAPTSGCAAYNAANCWFRGDLRWYGLNLSGAATGGMDWNDGAGTWGTTCDASKTTAGMGCPRGPAISWFSPFDNPYLLRAFSPIGISYTGATLNPAGFTTPDKTIYEFLAPTSQPDYTMSWWGEIEVGRTGSNSTLGTGTGKFLKSQTIIRGNAAKSVYRLFQTTDSNAAFSFLYQSYLQGFFRFSTAQLSGATNDTVGQAPRFDSQEGMYFENVRAYMPFGQLYYQSVVLNSVGAAGNFSWDMARIPSGTANVINSFYALRSDDTVGYETARLALMAPPFSGPAGAACAACWNGNDGSTNVLLNYMQTHGYSTWGDWYPTCHNVTGVITSGCLATPGTRNLYTTTNDGIFFQKCLSGACANFNAYANTLARIDVDKSNCGCYTNPTYQYAYYGNPNGLSAGVTTPNTSTAVITIGDNAGETGVNIGDSRAAGILINYFHLESCLGSTTC